MNAGIKFKVCGITRAADAQAAAEAGASWIGINLYPKSPRYLPLERYRAMLSELPSVSKVVVLVEPSEDELAAALGTGFDFFQVHFRLGEKGVSPRSYASRVPPDRLWLAPKLAPGVNVPAALLPIAPTILMDTFQADAFGGTGKTGDWPKFARHMQAHPETTWILSGGLSPANIGAAVAASGARIVDVNSGVESAPGVKDRLKLRALAKALCAAG